MVTPVISEQLAHAATDRTARSNRKPADPAGQDQAAQTQSQGTTPDAPSPQIDAARQRLQMEASQHQAIGPGVETPEQARTLLDRILPQITASPDTFLRIQSGPANLALTNLLENAPGY